MVKPLPKASMQMGARLGSGVACKSFRATASLVVLVAVDLWI